MGNNNSFDAVAIVTDSVKKIIEMQNFLNAQIARLGMAARDADISAGILSKKINWETGDVTDLNKEEDK